MSKWYEIEILKYDEASDYDYGHIHNSENGKQCATSTIVKLLHRLHLYSVRSMQSIENAVSECNSVFDGFKKTSENVDDE